MKLKHIYRAMLPTLGLLAALNVALAAWVWVRVRRPVEYNVQVVEPPRFELPVVTNVTTEARRGLLPETQGTASGRVLPSPQAPVAWRHRYHYCVVQGRRVAVLNGVQVHEGDAHAYGVVSRIYPERIYFEGGAYIDNESARRNVDVYDATAAAVP